MIHRQVNIDKSRKCKECGNEILLYETMYREKRKAPELDIIPCNMCGSKLRGDEYALKKL